MEEKVDGIKYMLNSMKEILKEQGQLLRLFSAHMNIAVSKPFIDPNKEETIELN